MRIFVFAIVAATWLHPAALRAEEKPSIDPARIDAMVKAGYEAGLAAGGRDNGGPGERDYHPGYYAAFLLDPDGNNIELVYHGPMERSAASVEITANLA